MVNAEGVVLNLLLHSRDKEQALLAYSKLREKFFSPSFSVLYKHISVFYEEHNYLPSFEELKLFRSRDKKTQSALASLQLVPTEDIDIDLAIETLINDYSQDVALDLMSNMIKSISLMDRQDIQDKLATFPILFDEELQTTEGVYTPKDVTVFKSKADSDYVEVKAGISNKWDTSVAYRRQELGLIGGYRGSGKSLLCANMVSNQMDMGNVGVYFTIEMTYDETFQRILSIRSGVPYKNIRSNELTEDNVKQIAKTISGMYVGGEEVFNKHFLNCASPDRFKFESELKQLELREEGKLVIIDDRELSLSTIDVQLSKLKSQYGDKLEIVAIDYLNQIVWEGYESDMYDWKVQVNISKQLKNLARKYDLFIASPFQIDESGGTRFAKGILDACDTAQLIKRDREHPEVLVLETTKARSGDDTIICTATMDWETLKIDPSEVDLAALEGVKENNTEEAIEL